MSNALEFQLFVGLPSEEVELAEKDLKKYGLESYAAGNDFSSINDEGKEDETMEFIGLIVGDVVSWEGKWSDEVKVGEFEKVMKKVTKGLAKAGVERTPGLYWLVNFW